MQPEERENTPSEVSTYSSNCFRQRSIHMNVPNVRKRLNALSTSGSSMHSTNSNLLSAPSSLAFKQLETVADPKSKSGFKTKIYPTRISIENRQYTRQDSMSTKRSSSRESSDIESDSFTSQKKCEYKNEEKSHLICYKDNIKIISFKNDSRLTKYSTFDINVSDRRGKMVKYKSLDEPQSKTLVKYLDPQSKVSISAQDFGTDFKFSRIERRRNKHDIITETVDAWAKKNNKGMFSNIKNTIFKNGTPEREIVFKPLVFGGTFPIDRPESELNNRLDARGKENTRVMLNHSAKVREYGPPKTFNIDQPI